MRLSLIHVTQTHAVHRYRHCRHSWFFPRPPRTWICRSDIAVSRKRDRDMRWCVSNAERETIAGLSSVSVPFAHFRRVPFRSVPFRSPRLYTPSNFWFTRPRWNSMNAKCNPLHNPSRPRLFSRPVTSGHITIPRSMWNFAFQSCPPSNKRRQLPTGNIFSAKRWAIYLERKRLDTSGSTEESRIYENLLVSLAENPWKLL